jgi:hypothetical protein
VEVLDRNGSSTGLRNVLAIPRHGQLARFINEIPGFASLPLPFQGTVRVTSTAPVSLIVLRGRYNERGDYLVATLPVVNEDSAAAPPVLAFPQVAGSSQGGDAGSRAGHRAGDHNGWLSVGL